MRVPPSSRQRFEAYLEEHRRKRKAGEIVPLAKPHGKSEPRKKLSRPLGTLLWEFWHLLRSERPAVTLALVTLTVSTLLTLIPPAVTRLVIDDALAQPAGTSVTTVESAKHVAPHWLGFALPQDKYQLIFALAGIVVVISLLETLIHMWGRWHATRATKRVQVAVRKQLFEHVVRFPLHRIYQLKSGGVASTLREDAGAVGELIFNLLYNPWRAVIQFLGSLVILALVDWRLLVGGLMLLPLVILSHRAYVGRLRPLYRDIRLQREEIDAQAAEAFGGMRVVRGFGRQRSETGRFVRGNHVMARQELLTWWWSRGIEIAWAITIPMASAALLLYGGWQVLNGGLTLGALMMFLFYLAMLLGPLAVLANSSTQFQNNLAALDRVLDLLAEPLEFPDVPNALEIQPGNVRGRVTLDNVSFRYPTSDKDVLTNINLDVLPGEMLAFVGPSGAGKTTLCNLIARFYDPTQGSVRLDGTDLREIDLEHFRNLLGIVEQEVFLFDGSVAENIGYGDKDATLEEVRAAAKLAHADEFILQLEQGYDTKIGERGVRLSGGQRQRLAIARAILANPRILILDEATSNLDTESEQYIQESLVEMMKGRTSFVIAHRLSTIRHAHRIVVVDHGRIIEMGTHAELLKAGGRYRDMVRLQLGPDVAIGEN
ncbi:MAG: putative multidrug export ATP-binding/permease protein [Planctomycetaceae bacterium]|nr:putative multidrug export ATP-binding/permease protein [Planctomycetaceae bacterium]